MSNVAIGTGWDHSQLILTYSHVVVAFGYSAVRDLAARALCEFAAIDAASVQQAVRERILPMALSIDLNR